MAKIGVFKKIAALVTAIALVVCFAVSASAEISVSTSTTYVTVSGEQLIDVDVTVSGAELEVGKNVTYYAYDGSTPVHIDQTEVVTAGSAHFDFYADADDLNKSVKVSYTGASEANVKNETIKAFTVTLDEETKYIATEGGTITLGYEPESGYTVPVEGAVSVTSGNATVADYEYSSQNDTLSVTLTDIEGNVVLSVDEEPSIETEAVPMYINGKGIIATDRLDWTITGTDENGKEVGEQNADHNASEGNRKITVIASASKAKEYGIIVSSSKINDKVEVDSLDVTGWDVYQSLNAVDAKAFAVQLIDTSDENDPQAESFIKSGETYYVSVYAQDAGNNKYVVTASEEIAIPAAN